MAVNGSLNGNSNIREFWNANGLHFQVEQIKIFAYIADCIASHNVYKAQNNESDKIKYADYSLNGLLQNEYKPISYDSNPLLFILCLADTIEPSKNFSNCDNSYVLKHISIKYKKKDNSIHVVLDEELNNCDDAVKYKEKVRQLGEWCDIKVSISTDM